ncbi:hypothetical protein CRE_14787 [Caenorhabditis remanei]|uniref:F-box domain-containing protein n=1 Tax=Caenorhabditis remanei TaxID=31234 RepID=E3MRP9_CAERE|nr:hypothetical protein CRE_14787 [Caenorhabditis remanei]
MSSEFPLFRLPLIVLNHGLKLMTPFEIISLSLCSKRCKTVCQSLRNQLKCKEKAVKFQLKFSKKREIRMEFNYYPNIRWILSIFQVSEKDEIGFSRNDLFVTNWIPTEEDTPQEQIRENNSMVNRYLKVYISNDYDIFILRKYIDHLSYIFNITLTNLELHSQDFARDENEIIIDSYTAGHKYGATLIFNFFGNILSFSKILQMSIRCFPGLKNGTLVEILKVIEFLKVLKEV